MAVVKRIAPLDGLRGIFALVVMTSHFYGDARWWKNYPFQNAGLAVDFFFMLSGFVLALVYESAMRREEISSATFIGHRFARLYPLHIFTMAAMGVANFLMWHKLPYEDGVRWTAILNILLLQDMPFSSTFSWNEPSWSISVEFWIGILVLPTVFRIVRTEILLLISIFTYLIIFAFGHTLAQVHQTLVPGITFGMARAFGGILLGVCIYRIRSNLKMEIFSSARHLLGVVEGSLFAVIIYISYIPMHGKIEFMAAFMMPFFILSVASSRSWFAIILESRPMQWLGKISYSLYLVHMPVICFASAFGIRSISNETVRYIVVVAIILISSDLVNRFFEIPVSKRLRVFLGSSIHSQSAMSKKSAQ